MQLPTSLQRFFLIIASSRSISYTEDPKLIIHTALERRTLLLQTIKKIELLPSSDDRSFDNENNCFVISTYIIFRPKFINNNKPKTQNELIFVDKTSDNN